MQPPSDRRKRSQRGTNILEFALVSIFLVPLMLGTVYVGVGLGRSIQCAQIARDAGHMFVRQVDFSQVQNQDLIVRLAQGLGMTRTGGNGVVILTQVLMISSSECAAAGLSDPECTNLNFPVITQRVTIGNASLFSSTLGNPGEGLVQGDGTILPGDYLTDPSCRAATLTVPGPGGSEGLLTLNASERTYVSEAYFKAPEWEFLRRGQSDAVYAKSYF